MEIKQGNRRPRIANVVFNNEWKREVWKIPQEIPTLIDSKKKREFIDRVLPAIRRVGVIRDFNWFPILVTACVDSDFGELELSDKNSRMKSNNIFMIPSNYNWTGGEVELMVPHNVLGMLVMKPVKFKRYSSLDDCVNDWLDFLFSMVLKDSSDQIKDMRTIRWMASNSIVFLRWLYKRGYFYGKPKNRFEAKRTLDPYIKYILLYLQEKGWIDAKNTSKTALQLYSKASSGKYYNPKRVL